jgi:hypothetical protein
MISTRVYLFRFEKNAKQTETKRNNAKHAKLIHFGYVSLLVKNGFIKGIM